MSEKKKKLILSVQYDTLHILYAVSCCCISTYATVYLQSRGYSNTALGFIVALGQVMGILIGPVLAAVIDRSRRVTVYHCLYAVMAAELLAELALLMLPGKSISVSLVFAMLTACFIMIQPMAAEIRFQVNRTGKYIDYGEAMGIRSVFYVPATYIIGRLCDGRSPEILPLLGFFTVIVQIASLLALRRTVKRIGPDKRYSADKGPAGSTAAEFIRGNRRFCLFCAGVALLFFASGVSECFLINIIRDLGGDTSSMATLSALMAVAEIPFMLGYTRITKNIRGSSVLIFSAAMYAVKAAAYIFVPNLTALYCTSIIHGPSYGLIATALVEYTGAVVSSNDSAKAQTMIGAAGTVGGILASSVGGILFDSMTVKGVLLVSAVLCAVSAAVIGLTVDRKTA